MDDFERRILELKIDKASYVLFETGKKVLRGNQMLLFFSFLTILIYISPGVEGFVKVGFISLNREYALIIFLVLSSNGFFGKLSMTYHQGLLSMQITYYLKKLGSRGRHWYMLYPFNYVFVNDRSGTI